MQINTVVFTILLLFLEFNASHAKAIVHMPSNLRRRNSLEYVRKAMSNWAEEGITRRDPQTTSSSLLTPSSSNTAVNQTIASACIDALDRLSNISNDAGMSACYNIIQYDPTIPAFQADLRLYQSSSPSGPFASIPVNSMTIGLTYPSSTIFKSLTKRATPDNSTAQIQQYSLYGSFVANTDLTSLNTTQLLSLMVPTITINAVDNSQNPITANITSNETIFFVTGQFQGDASAAVINPTIQAGAVTQSSKFVLPGTTFGIFPVGFIVTMAWTVLFFLAFAIGTIGRISHRNIYRKRIAATLGRTAQKL